MTAYGERREAARKLREYGPAVDDFDIKDKTSFAFRLIDLILGTDESSTWREVFSRLADLVDPDGGD